MLHQAQINRLPQNTPKSSEILRNIPILAWLKGKPLLSLAVGSSVQRLLTSPRGIPNSTPPLTPSLCSKRRKSLAVPLEKPVVCWHYGPILRLLSRSATDCTRTLQMSMAARRDGVIERYIAARL